MSATSRTEEHVGEWRVSLDADDATELFSEVARLIASTAGTTAHPPGAWEEIAIRARDLPTLLADFANEMLGRSEVAASAYGELRDVRLALPNGEARIVAQVRGCPVSTWLSPVKAATYHGLVAERRGPRWHAELLFDV